MTYLDHAATTQLRPEARAAIEHWLTHFGNPSGDHAVARAARKAIDEARDAVAGAVGARPDEVVFTSGGTESDNLAVAGSQAAEPGPLAVSALEHEAVLQPAKARNATIVPADEHGTVRPDALAGIDPGTTLVSVMTANNEVGTIQPIGAIAEAARRRAPGTRVHTDAVQAAAWLDLSEATRGADLVSLSAHKVGGPQGVGALVVRRGTPLAAQALGGGQERELRSGTHNVAGIAGFAAALTAAVAERDQACARVEKLRDRLAEGLLAAVAGSEHTAATAQRLPGTLHLTIAGVESEALLFLLDEAGVCASAASACASGAQQASHVLAAMGVPAERARGALRLSLGWPSTDEDVDRALDVIPAAVARLRGVAA